MNERHDDPAFQDAQTRILSALASAVIGATPEWWTEATLRLEDTPEGCAHELHSDQHPGEIVTATDEIFAQTALLQDLFADAGSPWKIVNFRVFLENQGAEERWRFKVIYTYQ